MNSIQITKKIKALIAGIGKVVIKFSDNLSIPYQIRHPELKKIVEKNSVFKNSYKNKRCFILGNGPSLLTHELDKLSGETTFVMGSFFRHPINKILSPTFYCLGDPVFFDGSEVWIKFFKDLNQFSKPENFLVPLSAYNTINKLTLIPAEKTYYVDMFLQIDSYRPKEIELNKTIPYFTNSAQFCLMIAIYCGFKEIYLLGLDHDWLSHRGEDKHFYSFDKELLKHDQIKYGLNNWSYKYLMENQLRLWNGYENINQLAVKKNIKIFNVTNGGFLDVFERKNFNSLF